jgi:hypothetical protein
MLYNSKIKSDIDLLYSAKLDKEKINEKHLSLNKSPVYILNIIHKAVLNETHYKYSKLNETKRK